MQRRSRLSGREGSDMISMNSLAGIASQVGNPSRIAMLNQLLDGRSLTASELARASGISPQTASEHLAKLSEVGLLTVVSQGRCRYFRLASPHVAELLQALFRISVHTSDAPAKMLRTGPADEALRELRTCYDHLAGRLAVALTDALVARGFVELTDDGGLLTRDGAAFFEDLGLPVGALQAESGARAGLVCRPCLDWSERRPHLAGRLGTAFCRHCLESDWVRRIDGTRALSVTTSGRRFFDDILRVRAGSDSAVEQDAAIEATA